MQGQSRTTMSVGSRVVALQAIKPVVANRDNSERYFILVSLHSDGQGFICGEVHPHALLGDDNQSQDHADGGQQSG